LATPFFVSIPHFFNTELAERSAEGAEKVLLRPAVADTDQAATGFAKPVFRCDVVARSDAGRVFIPVPALRLTGQGSRQ
jgi:hypothetical protein